MLAAARDTSVSATKRSGVTFPNVTPVNCFPQCPSTLSVYVTNLSYFEIDVNDNRTFFNAFDIKHSYNLEFIRRFTDK